MFAEITFVCLGNGDENGRFGRLDFSFYSQAVVKRCVYIATLYLYQSAARLAVAVLSLAEFYFFLTMTCFLRRDAKLTELHEREPLLCHKYISSLGQRDLNIA